MRLIGTLDTLEEAKLFSANLCAKKIEHSLEGCQIWAHNEDQIDETLELFKRFIKNPADPEFDVPIIEPEPKEVQYDEETGEPFFEEGAEIAELLVPRRTGHFTTFLIAFCSLIYFLSAFQEMPLLEKGISPDTYISTPIQTLLFYDMPPEVEKLNQMVDVYNPPAGEKEPSPLPAAIQEQMALVRKTPFWRGIFYQVQLQLQGGDPATAEGPLFSKIAQGEFWRLLSPIFLHGSILHILFNMMWLWVLGRQIEQRVGVLRYALLTILLGVFANTLQYLMSGPFFLGYSGVILGLAGFIWSREHLAPWEGYPLQKPMVWFLGLYVLAMCLLQGVSFALICLSFPSFDPNIANTAHLAGGILGVLLGRISFFAARPAL